MATQAQIDANRRNSEKSTGPVSAEGKAASCSNALKSGLYAASTIIRGETAESFDELAAQYQKDFDPQTAVEQTLVDSLVAAAWILRRLVKVEAHLWERQFSGFKNPDPKTFLGDAYCNTSNNFSRHQRRQDSTSREYRATLKELMRVQDARISAAPPLPAGPEPEPAPAPTPQPIDPEPVIPGFGFVPSNAPDTPSDSPAEPQCPAASARHRRRLWARRPRRTRWLLSPPSRNRTLGVLRA